MHQKVNYILPYISKNMPNNSKKSVISLYKAQYTRDVVKLQTPQPTSIKMTEKLENMVYEQRLRELSLLSLKKQRRIAVFHCLRSGQEEELHSKRSQILHKGAQ